MSKLSAAESFTEYLSPDEDRLKKALAEIERISAELRLEDAISKIDRLAEHLREQSDSALQGDPPTEDASCVGPLLQTGTTVL